MTVIAVTVDVLDDGGTSAQLAGLQDLSTIAVATPSTTLQWLNTGNEILILYPTGAVTPTATVSPAADPKGRTTMPNGGVFTCGGSSKPCIIPFLDPALFNGPGGLATVTLSAITTLSYVLIRLRKR